MFPTLYEDFNRFVPVPNYCRVDGFLNIASHFPLNIVSPDLGPKMYNAFAGDDGENGLGSTRLHMDMADAVNIMMHTEGTESGTFGYAMWDIFRASDSEAIRGYLRRVFSIEDGEDPIHSQEYFLNAKLRRDLFEETGVKSFRVRQRRGDAVFIPAGCPHQVSAYVFLII